jgi:hypothetical protein
MAWTTVNINLIICVIKCGKIFSAPIPIAKRLKFEKVAHVIRDLQGRTGASSYLYANPLT